MNNNEFKEIEKNVEKQIEDNGIAEKTADKDAKEKLKISPKAIDWIKKHYFKLIITGVCVASLDVGCSVGKSSNNKCSENFSISVTTETTTDPTNPTDSTVALDEQEEFESNPKEIWNSNIFGKSLHELVNEGLQTKLSKMPEDAQINLQETLERIVNEGSRRINLYNIIRNKKEI